MILTALVLGFVGGAFGTVLLRHLSDIKKEERKRKLCEAGFLVIDGKLIRYAVDRWTQKHTQTLTFLEGKP